VHVEIINKTGARLNIRDILYKPKWRFALGVLPQTLPHLTPPLHSTPCGRAQLHRLSTVDAHTDVLKPIHGKII